MRGIAITAFSALLCVAAPAKADVLVTISKSQQQMTVSIDGVRTYHWTVSTGRPGYDTPSGGFRATRAPVIFGDASNVAEGGGVRGEFLRPRMARLLLSGDSRRAIAGRLFVDDVPISAEWAARSDGADQHGGSDDLAPVELFGGYALSDRRRRCRRGDQQLSGHVFPVRRWHRHVGLEAGLDLRSGSDRKQSGQRYPAAVDRGTGINLVSERDV